AVAVDLERAVAGVGHVAVRQQHLEEAAPFDRDVERVVGLHEVALREQLLRRDRADARAEHEPGRQLRVLGRLRARLADVLVDQVLEHGAALLEAARVDVREVVRDDRYPRLLRIETGLGNPQCLVHVFSPARRQPSLNSWAEAWSFCSAVFMSFTCSSKLRACWIMSTMADTTLTLLPSSVPESSLTSAAAGGTAPSAVRTRPSSPRTSWSA